MKRSKLILFALIALVFLIVSGIIIHQSLEEKAKRDADLKAVKTNWPLLKKAIEEANSSLCENFTPGLVGSFYKDVCYQKIAVMQMNKTLCDKIQNDLTKFLCYVRIYPSNNFSFCEETDKWIKETCYFYLGQFSTKEKCSKLSDGVYKNACLRGIAKRTGNLSLCKDMTNDQWNNCIGVVVKTTGNFSLCNKLTDLELRKKCKKNLSYSNLPFICCEGLDEYDECISLFLNSTEKELYSGRII